MRRRDDVTRLTAVLALATFLAGCVAPAPRPRPAPAPPSAPGTPFLIPPVPPPVRSGPAPPLPPVSIGPRVEAAPEPRLATPPPPPTTPPTPAAQRGRQIVLNFDNADIETVIHAASEVVGFNYVLAPDVRGKVTVQTSGRIAQEDVFGVLLAILEVHGFTAVKAGNLYKIVRIEGARERAVPTIVGGTPDPTRTGDEIVTQIVPIRFASAGALQSLLRPFVSSRGSLIAHPETNVLILTDAASNVGRILDIVRLVDMEVALEELQIIPIRHADAADLATILNQLFQSGRIRTAAPAAPPLPPAAPRAPAAPPAVPRPPAPPAAPPAETGAPERPPLIIAERRSNSLIVYARKHEVDTIRRLVAQLDADIYGGRRVFIYFAENAKAKDLAATLNAIYSGRETVPTAAPTPPTRRPGEPPPQPPPPPPAAPGPPIGLAPGVPGAGLAEVGVAEGEVRFIADETTNAVIATTYPRTWAEIEPTIRLLDKMPRQVLIEVLVAEITLTDDIRLGIDWAMRQGRFSFANQTLSTASPATIPGPSIPTLPPNGNITLPFAGLNAFTFVTDKFFAVLNTLASLNRVNVLSNPHVMTSENKKAVINVSDSIPIVTSQQVPIGGTTPTSATTTTAVVGTQTVEYRDAGVILTVTPRIGERGTVALDVKQEVNDIGPQEPPTGSRRIIKREAETAVVLLNNQTLVLGGLIRDRRSDEERGIPWLKDIPILGFFFGTRAQTTTKTELLILITPRVVGTALDAARITEELRRATPELDRSFRRAPRQPTPQPPVAPPPPAAPPVAPPPLPAAPVAPADPVSPPPPVPPHSP